MGLNGIHSPEALHQWSGLTFCPWCGKEGQNKGNVVNHLQTTHYHLGLFCTPCHNYFMTSTDTMHQHAQLFRSVAAGDDDNRGSLTLTFKKMIKVMITSTSFLKMTRLPHHLHLIQPEPGCLFILMPPPREAFHANPFQRFKLFCSKSLKCSGIHCAQVSNHCITTQY